MRFLFMATHTFNGNSNFSWIHGEIPAGAKKKYDFHSKNVKKDYDYLYTKKAREKPYKIIEDNWFLLLEDPPPLTLLPLTPRVHKV